MYRVKPFYKLKYRRHKSLKNKRINTRQLALKLSKYVYKKFKIKMLNIFEYLFRKDLANYDTYQVHLWHPKYKKHLYYFHNYFDIVNCFFIMSLLNNTENLLLHLMRIILPRIEKAHRFLYFLDSVIKNMPQIQNKFSCLKLLISGKLRGGTKRTNSLAIGFGVIPRGKLTSQVNNNFVCFRHKFGEFGIKLLLNKTIKVHKKIYKKARRY